jgi:hypothetical protein
MELLNIVLTRKKSLPQEQLSKYTTSTPNINVLVILIPREYGFWRPVVLGGNASHPKFLSLGVRKVADLKVAILGHRNVAWLQVAVDHTR